MGALATAMWLAATGGAAAEDLAVLRPETGRPPARLLYAYLQAEAAKCFSARRAAIDALRTPEDVRRRQAELRARFLEALGGFPERTPLNARVVGTTACDGYRVERVIYESRPRHHVTAVLYLPDGNPPFPGVLVPCGHSENGKAIEAYQRACILLAKNGLAALCYDPIGQGERYQILDDEGRPLVGGTVEHTMVGVGALLVGTNVAAYRIWDGIRSLDYLASRPEVDPRRLGCTGNSGGGTLTAYLMALDERIVAAAPSCYLTSLERLFATAGPQDAEQNITGQVAFGMEHADYVTLRAPRPTLICTATHDFFDIEGAWASYREAKRVYALLGHAERVDLFEYPDEHGFSRPRREAVVRWMRRWLLGQDDAPTEGDFQTMPEEALRCTRTGQVLADLEGRSVIELNAERERELAPLRARRRAGLEPKAWRAAVRQQIGVPAAVAPASMREVGRLERDACSIRKRIYTTEPGVTVTGLLFEPKGVQEARPLVLYVHGDGKAADAGTGGPIEARVQKGERVLALDLRGMGEMAPTGRAYDPRQVDFQEAFLSLHLNRPLIGQRVLDLLAVLGCALSEPAVDPEQVEAVGVGRAGPIVLHAAALDQRIRRVTLKRTLVSWSAVAQARLNSDQLANAVPGVLKVYDLPDLAAALAPRPLSIFGATDPVGSPISLEALAAAYASCCQAYRDAGASERLVLQAE